MGRKLEVEFFEVDGRPGWFRFWDGRAWRVVSEETLQKLSADHGVTLVEDEELWDQTPLANLMVSRSGSVKCVRCGRTFRASDEDVQLFDSTATRAFMQRHRDCGETS